MKKNLLAALLLPCCFAMFQSCNDEGNNPPATPDGNSNSGENVNLSCTGEISNVTILCNSDWYAETDDKWLQLSSMGGKGNETVEVIAAYNTATESRAGEIRIYSNGNNPDGLTLQSSKSSPVQVITVVQDGNAETAKPPCYTEFYYENGKVFFTLYGGPKGGSIYDVSENDILFYPKVPIGSSVPLAGIKKEKYLTSTAYIYSSDKNELKGAVKIGNERTANTLVIRQGNSFRKFDDLNNEGSASVHFVYNGKLYYGGGIISQKIFGGMVQYPSYADDLKCYDIKSGTKTELPSITRSGTGFGWDGSVFFVSENDIYILDNDAWSFICSMEDEIIGVQVSGNSVFFVAHDGVRKYNIGRNNGSVVFSLVSENLIANVISSDYCYTHDRNGDLYIYDKENLMLYWIENNMLKGTSLSETFGETAQLCGVDNGYAYILDESVMYKTDKSGNAEMLKLIVLDGFVGEYENIDGTIYCFGGIDSDGNSYFHKNGFSSFTPSEYVPVSLSIVPEQ